MDMATLVPFYRCGIFYRYYIPIYIVLCLRRVSFVRIFCVENML